MARLAKITSLRAFRKIEVHSHLLFSIALGLLTLHLVVGYSSDLNYNNVRHQKVRFTLKRSPYT